MLFRSSGPCLRGSGINHDLRRATPYWVYDKLDFDVITHNDCDTWARYIVRVQEMKESVKIIHQVLDNMPKGSVLADDPKHVLPQKAHIYTKMEELINDFMLINFGSMPPKGETYTAIEGPKGELGFFIVSDGTGHPWKLKKIGRAHV